LRLSSAGQEIVPVRSYLASPGTITSMGRRLLTTTQREDCVSKALFTSKRQAGEGT